MFAYLIDPFARNVTRVERTAERGTRAELDELYTLLDCDTVEAIRPHNADSDMLYVDENGKMRDPLAFFLCRLWPHEPLTGRALWVGTTPEGDDADPACTLEYVRAHIVWSAT
jgi:hypothetical protein